MKKTINLPFISILDENLKSKNGLIQVLIGPRQVGKTTTIEAYLAKYFKTNSIYISSDEVFNSSASWLVEYWHRARNENKLLVVDEIQKCENWPEVVKKLWDEDKRNKKHIQCILLGSSSLEIQKGISESLTGRFQLIKAHHWNFAESEKGYELNFEQYLKFGGYPGSYQFKKLDEWRRFVSQSIISTVVEKDILQYNTVKKPALFKQAFEILISYPAQEISYTKLLGQLQDKGNVEVIKYYISLYEGAFLIKTLEKFSSKKILTKASSPKILPLAPCLYFLNILDDYSADERGRAFELIVGAQLVRTEYDLYYWREGQHEVDYVLKRGRNIWAIEVKSGRKKSSEGLLKFKEKFPDAKLVFITPENYIEFEKNPMAYLEKFN